MFVLYFYLVCMFFYYLFHINKYLKNNSNKCFGYFHKYKGISTGRVALRQECEKCGKIKIEMTDCPF